MEMETPLPVLVRRLSADPDLTGPAGLAALDLTVDRVVLTPDSGAHTLVLPLAELAGLSVRLRPGIAAALLLHPLRGVAVAVQARDQSREDDLLALARRAEQRAFALPEFTRGLRAVGARRGAPGGDHDRWFGALLAARQEAAHAEHWNAQVAALAPAPLRRLLAQTVASLALSRYPASPPDQRALAAALEECASQFDGALEALALAAERLGAADDAERLVAWRDWVGAARHCFAAADSGWLAMAPLLARHEPPAHPLPAAGAAPGRRRWWRRDDADGQAR